MAQEPANIPVQGDNDGAELAATPPQVTAAPVLTAVQSFENVDATLAETVAKMQSLLHHQSQEADDAANATWFGPPAQTSESPKQQEYTDEEQALEALEAEMKDKTREFELAKKKLQDKKEKERQDAATAAPSGGLPPGMSLPRPRQRRTPTRS